MKNASIWLSAFLLSIISVSAQKLPTVQQTSLRAPADIKIDGKATEWNNKFQAYNKAVEASYTIANDNNKLYLAIQITDRDIINKIINSGVSFTINGTGKKNDKDGVTITYPHFGREDRPVISLKNTPVWSSNVAVAKMQADSFMNINNKQLTDKAKEIMVRGIKEVDSLISIYNQDGVKAAGLFDNKMAYSIEMSVELKSLNLSTTDKLTYNIKFNALDINNMPGVNITRNSNNEITSVTINKDMAPRNQTVSANTDFWGEYVLVK